LFLFLTVCLVLALNAQPSRSPIEELGIFYFFPKIPELKLKDQFQSGPYANFGSNYLDGFAQSTIPGETNQEKTRVEGFHTNLEAGFRGQWNQIRFGTAGSASKFLAMADYRTVDKDILETKYRFSRARFVLGGILGWGPFFLGYEGPLSWWSPFFLGYEEPLSSGFRSKEDINRADLYPQGNLLGEGYLAWHTPGELIRISRTGEIFSGLQTLRFNDFKFQIPINLERYSSSFEGQLTRPTLISGVQFHLDEFQNREDSLFNFHSKIAGLGNRFIFNSRFPEIPFNPTFLAKVNYWRLKVETTDQTFNPFIRMDPLTYKSWMLDFQIDLPWILRAGMFGAEYELLSTGGFLDGTPLSGWNILQPTHYRLRSFFLNFGEWGGQLKRPFSPTKGISLIPQFRISHFKTLGRITFQKREAVVEYFLYRYGPKESEEITNAQGLLFKGTLGASWKISKMILAFEINQWFPWILGRAEGEAPQFSSVPNSSKTDESLSLQDFHGGSEFKIVLKTDFNFEGDI